MLKSAISLQITARFYIKSIIQPKNHKYQSISFRTQRISGHLVEKDGRYSCLKHANQGQKWQN